MGDCLKQSPSLLYKYLNLKSTMKIKNFFLILLCLSLGLSAGAKNKTKVIAHRGYWKIEGSAQNSIKSLEEADRIKVYALNLMSTLQPIMRQLCFTTIK